MGKARVRMVPQGAGGRCRPTNGGSLLPGETLVVSQGLICKQEVSQLMVEGLVLATNPLKDHRGMLFLLVAVVGENRPQLIIVAGVNALVVPVYRFQLLHQ